MDSGLKLHSKICILTRKYMNSKHYLNITTDPHRQYKHSLLGE